MYYLLLCMYGMFFLFFFGGDAPDRPGAQGLAGLALSAPDPFVNSMPLHLSLAHTPLPRHLCELRRAKAHA